MYRPQKLVAALFSAALICTTGIALADKGGNHDKHGGSSHGSAASAPGQSGGGQAGPNSGPQRGPGGIGGPQAGPGAFDRSMTHGNRTMGDGARGTEFEGDVDDASVRGMANAKAGVKVRLANGATQSFGISDAALDSLKKHQGRGELIFFTANGQQITAVCARGEKDTMRVTARTGDTFTLQDQSGQTRLITLDSKTASRLHVKLGSNVEVTATSATSGRIVAVDMIKAHAFDKFAHRTRTDIDVAKVDIDTKKVDNDQAKLDIDVKRGKKADIDDDKKKLDVDVAKLDIDCKCKAKKADVDVAKIDVDSKSKKARKSKADNDNDVADIDLKAHAGKCGHGSSRNGNPAFDNQMAKDAANDASGHNPPGLPHECVNPAGHTRGFCKSSSSSSMCGGSGSVGGGGQDVDVAKTDVDTHSKKARKSKADNDNDVADVDVKAQAGKCGHGSSRNGNPAFNNQMAKDAANDASGHNPPGLPHECVNPAGHTRGFCKSSSSESMCGSAGGSGGGETEVAANTSKPCAPSASSKSHTNPAFANQAAKDAANDASGHNPPGLPHECVNPAGHTRGFCKTHDSESSAMCGSGGAGGVTPSDLHGGIANRNAVPGNGANGAAVAGANGSTVAGANVPRARGFSPSESGMRGPGSPVGVIPVAGGTFAPGTSVASAARGGVAPAGTHVLGASTGPGAARHHAATRVLPVAIQPVGKRRCVWYKTGVLAASTGSRIIGTSARSGKPVLHKKCR